MQQSFLLNCDQICSLNWWNNECKPVCFNLAASVQRLVFSPDPVERDHTVLRPSNNFSISPSPSASFFLLPFFLPPLFPDSRLPGAGDSTGTMGWYHWSAPSSLSACCTITGCCSSSVAYCEVRESKREEKRRQRVKKRVWKRWRERKKNKILLKRDRKRDEEILIFLCSVL